MMKKLLLTICLTVIPFCAFAQQGGGVVLLPPITPGNCAKWYAFNILEDAGGSCQTGGALSISNSDSTLTLSPNPITGTGTISLNLANANTWTAKQSFTNGDFSLLGSSSGFSLVEAPATGGGTATLPAGSGTLAYAPTGGTGNALFGTVTGNVANDIVTMSNTTTGIKDSGTALSALAPLASPTFTGTVTFPDSGTWGASGLSTTQPASFATINISSTSGSVANGIGKTAANTVGLYANSSLTAQFNSGGVFSKNASSWYLPVSNASATVPSLVPNQSAVNSGLGASSAGNATIIASNGTGGGGVNVVDAAFNGVTISQPLTVSTIGTGTGDFICGPIGGGLISQGVTTCVASDKRVKNDLGIVTPDMAIARIMSSPDEHLFTYKSQRYGASGVHGGWFAQDIQKDADYRGTVYKSGPTPLTPDGELTFDKGELGPDTTTAVKWLVTKERGQQIEIVALLKDNDNLSRRLAKLEHHTSGRIRVH